MIPKKHFINRVFWRKKNEKEGVLVLKENGYSNCFILLSSSLHFFFIDVVYVK